MYLNHLYIGLQRNNCQTKLIFQRTFENRNFVLKVSKIPRKANDWFRKYNTHKLKQFSAANLNFSLYLLILCSENSQHFSIPNANYKRNTLETMS